MLTFSILKTLISKEKYDYKNNEKDYFRYAFSDPRPIRLGRAG